MEFLLYECEQLKTCIKTTQAVFQATVSQPRNKTKDAAEVPFHSAFAVYVCHYRPFGRQCQAVCGKKETICANFM